MKANLINECAVQIGNETRDYKTLAGAEKAYEKARKEFTNGEIVSLVQYTDVVNNVEVIKCNM